MDLLSAARQGFQGIDADPVLKDKALQFLQQWLTGADFASYRPQLEWMIQAGKWADLLDSFYQVLPFGTGGRRGGVGIGPNRMNLWTLGASVQGHCEYLKARFPGHTKPLQVVLAYDVRQFEDKRKIYNLSLPNPVLHLSSRDFAHYAASVYVANGVHAWLLPPDSKRFVFVPPEFRNDDSQLRCAGHIQRKIPRTFVLSCTMDCFPSHNLNVLIDNSIAIRCVAGQSFAPRE